MHDCMITFRSVMPAQRAEGLLQRAGIGCSVRRTPKWMERQGCGYSLQLSCGSLVSAVELMRQNGVAYRKLYRRRESGRLEEMEL